MISSQRRPQTSTEMLRGAFSGSLSGKFSFTCTSIYESVEGKEEAVVIPSSTPYFDFAFEALSSFKMKEGHTVDVFLHVIASENNLVD